MSRKKHKSIDGEYMCRSAYYNQEYAHIKDMICINGYFKKTISLCASNVCLNCGVAVGCVV